LRGYFSVNLTTVCDFLFGNKLKGRERRFLAYKENPQLCGKACVFLRPPVKKHTSGSYLHGLPTSCDSPQTDALQCFTYLNTRRLKVENVSVNQFSTNRWFCTKWDLVDFQKLTDDLAACLGGSCTELLKIQAGRVKKLLEVSNWNAGGSCALFSGER
jgi:hypothetical protein